MSKINTKEDALNIAKEIIKALDEKKAEDIKTLDISNVSVMADYFIIASGNNSFRQFVIM